MDARSLYNIPNDEELDALRHTLHMTPRGAFTAPSSLLLKLMQLILTLINFVFNDINYLQKKGCTMGTNCPPSSISFIRAERLILSFPFQIKV